MAHVITGTDAYPLPPTTVPDGGDPATATIGGPAPIDVPLQALEDKVTTALGRIGGLAGTTEWGYPVGVTQGRITLISPMSIEPSPVYVVPAGVATPVGLNTRWAPHYLNAAGAGPGGRDLITMTGKVYTSLTFHTGVLDLKGHTPSAGDIIQQFSFRVTTGSAQAVLTDRLTVSFVKRTLTGVQTFLATATSNALAATQTINLSALAETVGNGDTYALHIESSAGAAPGTEDYVVSITMSWDQVVPTRRS